MRRWMKMRMLWKSRRGSDHHEAKSRCMRSILCQQAPRTALHPSCVTKSKTGYRKGSDDPNEKSFHSHPPVVAAQR